MTCKLDGDPEKQDRKLGHHLKHFISWILESTVGMRYIIQAIKSSVAG
jgi:hypothetical protein